MPKLHPQDTALQTKAPTAKTTDNLKVVKKLAPGQPGTQRLLEQYGDALVCVRYRHDSKDLHRWTTVELVIERRPVQGAKDPWLWVRVEPNEFKILTALRATGARWSHKDQLWKARRSAVVGLGLDARVQGPVGTNPLP